jgi:putative DNA primase/helicase
MRLLLIEWMAHLVQKPLENSKTCVVLAGGKGCGKDTLGDFIGGWILGRSYYHNYTNTTQFWDPYDEARFGKIFVKLEEAQGEKNIQNEAAFKARITSEDMTVNPKGRKAMTMPNYARYFLTTNEASPVKLDDNERRFVVIPCSPELIGKMDYWRALRATLFNPAGAYSVATWLTEQTIGIFPRMLPKSELHKEIIETERTTEERFAMESGPWAKEEMTATELFQEYRSWCLEHGHTPTVNSRWFGRNLSQVAMDGKVKKRMLDGKHLYSRIATVEVTAL